MSNAENAYKCVERKVLTLGREPLVIIGIACGLWNCIKKTDEQISTYVLETAQARHPMTADCKKRAKIRCVTYDMEFNDDLYDEIAACADLYRLEAAERGETIEVTESREEGKGQMRRRLNAERYDNYSRRNLPQSADRTAYDSEDSSKEGGEGCGEESVSAGKEIVNDMRRFMPSRTPRERAHRDTQEGGQQENANLSSDNAGNRMYYNRYVRPVSARRERERLTPEELEACPSKTGILNVLDERYILMDGFERNKYTDIMIPSNIGKAMDLKPGDEIECKYLEDNPVHRFSVRILSINGKDPENIRPRLSLEDMTPCYPDKRYTLEREGGSLTERVIDLFTPIGNGQRALIVSPPKAGKTTMLKTVAKAIIANRPDAKVIILLVDERPEEVTDITRSVEGAKIFYSTFDMGENHHIEIAQLAMAHARRSAEAGKDVVILVDSLTRITRAYNNSITHSGRSLSGGLDAQALIEPRKFFGAARNVEGGGSLTVIATILKDTGSKLDDIIYEEFKSAGNMEIVLSRDMAERRVFPAIDIKSSGARKEELLLSEKELKYSAILRSWLAKKELSAEKLFKTMEKYPTNEVFLDKMVEGRTAKDE